MNPLSDEQREKRWKVKLPAIFEDIGLTREQIQAVAAGRPAVRVPRKPPKTERPICLVCGNRISKYTCQVTRQKKGKPYEPR